MSAHLAHFISRRLAPAGCALTVVLGASAGRVLAQDDPARSQEPTVSNHVGQRAEGFLGEPRIITRGIDFATRVMGDGGDLKNGLYPELSNMPTGAGWISAGPGYRHWLGGDLAMVEASAAISWRAYKMAQARIELPHLARSRFVVGSQVRWQDLTQVTFFGEGAAAPESNRSEYRLKSTNIAGYAIVRPIERLSAGYHVGWLASPSLLPPAGSFQRGNPATADVFPNDPVFATGDQPPYGYVVASLAYDGRDHRSHPTRGGILRFAWSSYHDRDAGTFSFDRSEAEGAAFVPLARSRIVLATHGWLVTSRTDAGRLVPFYLQPSLGGHNTLRGYTDFRFHDRNLLVVTVESRMALFAHADVALFADAGNVAPRVSLLNLDKTSFGAGVRMHSNGSTFARVDVAHGAEGWRFLFRLSDPLHLARVSRHTAALPFVP